ncbi:adenine phosphoribosyltransferase isoform X2 [Hylobates moloch]|uniref:adenine phosphoribosyltransferase isoform X2 n=1 Tax=Hylobates moloch TaxID=81572 RepID=UPI002676BE07|nr:adenine phosphoribosyltransferase isoform X2 [Hylobates moloch]
MRALAWPHLPASLPRVLARKSSLNGRAHPREASAPGRSSPGPTPPPWAAPSGPCTTLLLLGLLPPALLHPARQNPARSVGISANNGERARPVRAPGAWARPAHAPPPAAKAPVHSCLAAVRGAARDKEGRLDSHLCLVRTFCSVVRGMRERLKIDGALESMKYGTSRPS